MEQVLRKKGREVSEGWKGIAWEFVFNYKIVMLEQSFVVFEPILFCFYKIVLLQICSSWVFGI